jgi:hypothetical protein
MQARRNARRLRGGDSYFGKAATVEQATALKAHIKEKLLGFKQGQSARTQDQSVSQDAVPSEANPRAD